MHLRDTFDLHSKINVTNADNPGGHVIGQLYQITSRTKNTSFSGLRSIPIEPKKGDTMLVLEVRDCVDYPKMDWKDVHVLISGRLARFKIWAFQDLIDTQSIKLVN